MNKLSEIYKNGIDAENHLIDKYFTPIGVNLEKIPLKTSVGYVKTPDGYITYRSRRIALIEIKLIEGREEGHRNEFEEITTDNAIRRQIRNAKKQLSNVKSDLPKIIYLVSNETFFDIGCVMDGLFGRLEYQFQDSRLVNVGHRGLISLDKTNENIFCDNLISTVICYIPIITESKKKSYRLWIFENQDSIKTPAILYSKYHVNFHLVYASKKISIIKKAKHLLT